MRIVIAIAAAAIGLAMPMQGHAQSEPTAALDDGKLALATEIIDSGFPPDTRMGMFDDVINQLLAQMRTAIPNVDNDPEMAEVFDRHVERVRATSMEVLSEHIDPLMNAMAIAYADEFTLEELQALHAYVTSPQGHGFLARTAAINAHPAFSAANQAYMQDYLSHMPQLMEQLREDAENMR